MPLSEIRENRFSEIHTVIMEFMKFYPNFPHIFIIGIKFGTHANKNLQSYSHFFPHIAAGGTIHYFGRGGG